MINKVLHVLGFFVILAAAALAGGLGRELGDLTTGPLSRFFEPTPQEIEEYMIEDLETAAGARRPISSCRRPLVWSALPQR